MGFYRVSNLAIGLYFAPATGKRDDPIFWGSRIWLSNLAINMINIWCFSSQISTEQVSGTNIQQQNSGGSRRVIAVRCNKTCCYKRLVLVNISSLVLIVVCITCTSRNSEFQVWARSKCLFIASLLIQGTVRSCWSLVSWVLLKIGSNKIALREYSNHSLLIFIEWKDF